MLGKPPKREDYEIGSYRWILDIQAWRIEADPDKAQNQKPAIRQLTMCKAAKQRKKGK